MTTYPHPTHFVKTTRRIGFPCVKHKEGFQVLGGAANGDIIRDPLEVKPWRRPRKVEMTRGKSYREVLFIEWENGKSAGPGAILYRHTEKHGLTGWVPVTNPEPLNKPNLLEYPPLLGRGQYEMHEKCRAEAGTIVGHALGADKDEWLNNPAIAADRAFERAFAEDGTNYDALAGDWEADADAFFAEQV